MATTRAQERANHSDLSDQDLPIPTKSLEASAANLEQSHAFQLIEDSPPLLPLMTKYLGRYKETATKAGMDGTHSIGEYTKRSSHNHAGKKKQRLFKRHTSKRMAEIEACNFEFVHLLAPNKSPKAVSIVDEHNRYQYAGVMMEKIPFTPYSKRRLRKEHLALPKVLQKELLDYQSNLLAHMASLKKFYEDKRLQTGKAMQEKATSSSSWFGFVGSAISTVASSAVSIASDYYNSYYSETSSGLLTALSKYLLSNKITEADTLIIQQLLTNRRTYLASLNRPASETQDEETLLITLEQQTLKTISALQNKKTRISTINLLENIYTQCNKIASPDLFTYRVSSHIVDTIIKLKTTPHDSSSIEDGVLEQLSQIGIDAKTFSTIDQKQIADIKQLIDTLIAYRKNHSINRAISETLDKERLSEKNLPTLSVHLNKNGKPTYSIQQPKSTTDLLGILEKAKNTNKIPQNIYDAIISNLVDGNRLLTCAVIAWFCPAIIKTEIKVDESPDITLTSQDIDNYAIKKGLAECLVINLLLKENDLHGGNFDLYGTLIDPDMKMWDIGHEYKLQDENFLNSSLRKPGPDSFKLSSKTIVSLPCVYEDGYYFWPTKSYSLRATAKIVAGSTSQANEFNSEDNQLFSQLTTDPIFIFHKFKTLAKFTLMDPRLFKEIAKSHIDSRADNGELLEKMTASIVNRIEETKVVLNNTPEYQAFLEEAGDSALNLITKDIEELKNTFEAKLKRATDKNNERKVTYYQNMLQGVEVSLDNINKLRITLTGKSGGVTLDILQTSSASDSILSSSASPSRGGLFGSSGSNTSLLSSSQPSRPSSPALSGGH